MASGSAGSASIVQPDYWWYTARESLLETALGGYVGEPRRVLDVGSADGPSVGWLRTTGHHVSLDVDPRGLSPGDVCGSALALPFGSGTFDVVAAFDVVEHCEPESTAMAELVRVLAPQGRLLMSVPAYQWAWTDFDEINGHYRRYTRARAVNAVEAAGLVVERATYAFMSVFPLFAAQRLWQRVTERASRSAPDRGPDDVPPLPQVSPLLHRVLLRLCRADGRLLARRDLPVGSSVLVAARKP
jgi:SAM-dependent methyltransferase